MNQLMNSKYLLEGDAVINKYIKLHTYIVCIYYSICYIYLQNLLRKFCKNMQSYRIAHYDSF